MLKHIIQNNKCLFIGAHYDDIEIGCLGLFQSNIKKIQNNLYFCILGRDITENYVQKNTSKKILENYSSNIFEYDLSTLIFDFKETKEAILGILNVANPEYIFFHSGIETHHDHKIINEVVKEVARPLFDNKLRGLIEYYIPLNSIIDFNYFNWNEIYSLSFDNKRKELEKFDFIKNKPDRRGINFIENINKLSALYNGNTGYSELFKITKFR